MHGSFGFGDRVRLDLPRVRQREVYDRFVDLLRAKTDEMTIGDPREQGIYLGPLINDAAGERYEGASPRRAPSGASSRAASGSPAGFRPRNSPADGRGGPASSWRGGRRSSCRSSSSSPTTRSRTRSASRTTPSWADAGFSARTKGRSRRSSGIQAGVVYVNRRSSSTTGAWPGLQTFGGWKSSGTSGRSVGGRFYVAQYLREQSRTVIAS